MNFKTIIFSALALLTAGSFAFAQSAPDSPEGKDQDDIQDKQTDINHIKALLLTALPDEMIAAQNKMERIREAKNIKPATKTLMEQKYSELQAGFNLKWEPLANCYKDKVEGPSAYRRELHDLNRQLRELQAKNIDPSDLKAYDEYLAKESFLRRRIADSQSGSSDREFLDGIIERKKQALSAWCKGSTMTNFLSAADRILSQSQSQKQKQMKPSARK